MTQPLSRFSKAKLTQLANIIERADQKYQRWIAKGREPKEGAMFGYNQRGDITHACGTPACAWGHWLARHPEDEAIRFRGDWETPFQITHDQMEKLFDYGGCGNAGTDAKKAVAFIRNAVKEGML